MTAFGFPFKTLAILPLLHPKTPIYKLTFGFKYVGLTSAGGAWGCVCGRTLYRKTSRLESCKKIRLLRYARSCLMKHSCARSRMLVLRGAMIFLVFCDLHDLKHGRACLKNSAFLAVSFRLACILLLLPQDMSTYSSKH